MSFNLLPAEVLEHILSYVDGVTLCLGKRVCKNWQKLIKQIESADHWRTLCVREIPPLILEELLAFNYIPPIPAVTCWHTLYRRWYKGTLPSNKKSIKKTVIESSLTNPITCMKISGSFVITGHNNGYISVWNHETSKLYQECRFHLKTITDIVLLDLLKVGTYFYKDDLFWSHHHIVTVSKDSVIRLKFLLEPLDDAENGLVLNQHGDIILSARVFEDKLLAHSRDNTISFWKLRVRHAPYLNIDVQFLRKIVGPVDGALSVGLWHDELFCVSRTGKLQVFSMEENKWSEISHFRRNWNRAKKDLDDQIEKFYTFRDRVIVLITTHGDMVVSIDEENFRQYKMFPYLTTSITSITLKGTLLALGCENGMLYLFYVADNKSLMHIFPLIRETCRLYLSEASIIAVDILYEIDCPVVVATTTNSIYVVKLLNSHKHLANASNHT